MSEKAHDGSDRAPVAAWQPPPGPALTVDCIVEGRTADDRQGVLLIERRWPPLGWALPGGFVELGESAPTAALRELHEETGLQGEILYQLPCYSDPRRDARRHTASVVFVVAASGQPTAGDDAGKAQFWAWDALPHLCFDHGQILADHRSGRFVPAFALTLGR